MEKHFPLTAFNHEAYETGNYTLVYRNGQRVVHMHRLQALTESEYWTANTPIVTVRSDGRTFTHYETGTLYSLGESEHDLMMAPVIEHRWMVLDMAESNKVGLTTFWADYDNATTYANGSQSRVLIDAQELWLSKLATKLMNDEA